MKRFKTLLALTGLLSGLLLSTPAQAQRQTSTVSSCYDRTTLGLINNENWDDNL